jgi:hypothetical protein
VGQHMGAERVGQEVQGHKQIFDLGCLIFDG